MGEKIFFISGQIPLKPDEVQIEYSDFITQAKQVFENLNQIVTAAKCEMEDVVKLTIYLTDLTNFDALNGIVQHIVQTYKRLDILVNNAGSIEPISHLAESDPNLWVKSADVNYKAVYFGIRSVLPHMLKVGRGIIINVSSGAASSPREGWSHYCSSKAAALMLTKMTHLEYASHGIRAIGLSPGTVATDMQVAIRASGINPISQLSPNSHSPVERPAAIIAWLCTDDAKEFDGGDVSLNDEKIRQRAGVS